MRGFGEIQRTRQLPTKIAADIGREITEGRILPGEKIPTEHVLAISFGVSRSVIREAIAQLRNEGLVETRQGVGAFATDLERRHTIRISSPPFPDQRAFQDLFQMRFVLETSAAAIAASLHTKQDLEAINGALSQMAGAEKWTEGGIIADLAFHRAVADATHNAYFQQFIGAIAERTHSTIRTARSVAVLEEIVAVTIAEHVNVRDAIAAGNALGAREAMARHLTGAAKRLGIELIDVHVS
ncbi:HTH-type transcriptional regulator LutR [compost metagenome]|jgi:GntR family transcriptional repressor for pyruvate dehydrogenase complex